jgi:hypothetical protein
MDKSIFELVISDMNLEIHRRRVLCDPLCVGCNACSNSFRLYAQHMCRRCCRTITAMLLFQRSALLVLEILCVYQMSSYSLLLL